MSEGVGTVAFGGRDDLSNIEWIGFDRSHTPHPYQGGKELKQFILSDELSTMLSHDQRETTGVLPELDARDLIAQWRAICTFCSMKRSAHSFILE